MADYKAVATIQQHEQPYWQVKLDGNTRKLLRSLNICQRRQAGETVVPRANADLEEELCQQAIEAHSPGEIEACISAAVGAVCRCHWQAGEEVLVVTREEAESVRAERRRISA